MDFARFGQLGRKANLFYRQALGRKVISIDGLKVSLEPHLLPKQLANSLRKGSHEIQERDVVAATFGPGDRIVEAGAGVGLVTMVAARAVGPENVLSYEANLDLAPVIRRNLELSGFEAVEVRMKAMAAEKGVLTFQITPELTTSSYVGTAQGHARAVEADGIASVIEEFRPTGLILDVEGAEVEILPAAPLEGVRAIVVELHPQFVGQEKTDAMLAVLAARGFRRTANASRSNPIGRFIRE